MRITITDQQMHLLEVEDRPAIGGSSPGVELRSGESMRLLSWREAVELAEGILAMLKAQRDVGR